MTVKLGVIMDPIDTVQFKKDSTLAMLLEAESRGWEIQYMEPADVFCRDGEVFAKMQRLNVFDDAARYYELQPAQLGPLKNLDVLLMRKDPPFDMEYVYATYLLDLVEASGVLVVNRPQALRDTNEKFAVSAFPQCCPQTLVTRSSARIIDFLREQGTIVVKPMDGMGGKSIFLLKNGDPNTNVVLETMTQFDQQTVMAQAYIPAISEGDKRILLVDGEPIPHVLARIPAEGEHRGNMAAGASTKGIPLGDRERWICEQVGPALRERGVYFAGLDVIGDYLTEINVTSPTGIREIDQMFSVNVSTVLFDALSRRLSTT
jgi:glutathione synthase